MFEHVLQHRATATDLLKKDTEDMEARLAMLQERMKQQQMAPLQHKQLKSAHFLTLGRYCPNLCCLAYPMRNIIYANRH